MFVCDPDGACVYANERLCELLGLTSEQFEDAVPVGAAWADASACGRDFHAEYRFLRHDGDVRWVEGSATAVYDKGRVLLG